MKKWVEGALTVYKKIPMSLVFFLILSDALVIFAPDRFAMLLAVDGFRDEYRKYLGPFFLFAVAALLSKCVPWLQRVVKQRRLKKKRIDLLRNLLPDEKGYLVQYVRKKKSTVYVELGDGVMEGLRCKGITYCPSNAFSAVRGMAYNLSNWARKELEANETLLDGYSGKPENPRDRFRVV